MSLALSELLEEAQDTIEQLRTEKIEALTLLAQAVSERKEMQNEIDRMNVEIKKAYVQQVQLFDYCTELKHKVDQLTLENAALRKRTK
jgi:uncharacterized protein (DUF3084 family)